MVIFQEERGTTWEILPKRFWAKRTALVMGLGKMSIICALDECRLVGGWKSEPGVGGEELEILHRKLL